jgi:glycerol-3-phosphate acyltransferase PlsX
MADEAPLPSTSGAARFVISVDAMGGDRGPAAVVAGLVLSAAANPDADFILHGDEAQVAPLLSREPGLAGRVTFRHAARTVSMTDKPSQVMRHGDGTSMWSCIDAVKHGEALAAVSCGNTGALMAVAMIRLRKLPGVNRPAIACLWPSHNPGGYNLMLDVGADVRAEPEDYVQYAMMGASYARNGLNVMRPRIGLLNVGTEEHKGRAEMKIAAEMITAAAPLGDYDYVGFVEGGDIPSDRVDVIVTDGFTGNVALKTGEGTAKLVSDLLRTVFTTSLLGRLAGFLVLGSLQRLQRRIDPRRVNGGVFLGLNGTVVKSHGSADETGVAAAIALAVQLSRSGFRDRLAARLASVLAAGQDRSTTGTGEASGAGQTE